MKIFMELSEFGGRILQVLRVFKQQIVSAALLCIDWCPGPEAANVKNSSSASAAVAATIEAL